MLRTLSSGAGVEMALGARAASIASVMWACHLPSARACPGHPRLFSCDVSKTWMAGTGPAMTSVGTISPPKPFRLARQFDGLDLLELDGALGHEIVEVAVGWPCDFRAIKIDLQRAAMVLLGPCRGIADAVHAGRHPLLLLIETLGRPTRANDAKGLYVKEEWVPAGMDGVCNASTWTEKDHRGTLKVDLYRSKVTGPTDGDLNDLMAKGTIKLEKVKTVELPRKPEWFGW